jgi:hypothetical protein
VPVMPFEPQAKFRLSCYLDFIAIKHTFHKSSRPICGKTHVPWVAGVERLWVGALQVCICTSLALRIARAIDILTIGCRAP